MSAYKVTHRQSPQALLPASNSFQQCLTHHIAISALRQIMINSYRLSCSTGCLFNGLLQLEAPAILMLQLVNRIRDSIQPSSARKDPEARASKFSSQALSPEGAPLYS